MSRRRSTPPATTLNAAALARHYERRHLDRLWQRAPFVLRITEWKTYPAPVLVISERGWDEEQTHPPGPAAKPANRQDAPVFSTKGALVGRGHVWGGAWRRIHPVIRAELRHVTDDHGVPLELDQYLARPATPFRGNLPLDDEAGAKLALTFRLSERVKDLDRVELIARRVAAFTREEAAYWLSRLVHFGKIRNQWAVTGLRILLAGESSGPDVETELQAIKT